jgi:hypothetical protein
MLEHPELKWNWFFVSKNPNLAFRHILANKEKNWDWSYLSRSKKITLKDFLEHPELPWDWDFVSMNPNITLKDVLEHPELPLDKVHMSTHRKENFESFFLEEKDPKNDTIKNRLKNPELLWELDYQDICKDPNLELKDVLKQPELEWQWDVLAQNKFLHDDTVYKNKIKNDIKKRRKEVKFLNLFGSLNSLVEKYVGYV